MTTPPTDTTAPDEITTETVEIFGTSIHGWREVPRGPDFGPDRPDGYVQVASFTANPASMTLELHGIRAATADDTCCRCTDPIVVGSQIHDVTVTGPDGTVTHRQTTHLHHLRG